MLCYAGLFYLFGPSLRNASTNLHSRTYASPTLPSAHSFPFPSSLRVIPRRLLTRLQLLEVEPTSAHITPGFIKALRELCRVRRTRSARLLLPVAALAAVVEAVVHGLGVCIDGILLVVVGLDRRGCFLG